MVYFVCGLLNSNMVQEHIENHTIQIQVSNIFKHLSLPQFEGKNPTHRKIASLCQQAHETSTSTERGKLLDKMNTVTEPFFEEWLIH